MDREKVKNALKLCAAGCDDDGCIYIDEHYDLAKGRCIDFLAADALELIEEQDERIKLLEHQLETLTKWRMNAGAFD